MERSAIGQIRGEQLHRILDAVRETAQPRLPLLAPERSARRVRIEDDRARQRALFGPVAYGEAIAGKHENRRFEPQLRDRLLPWRELLRGRERHARGHVAAAVMHADTHAV